MKLKIRCLIIIFGLAAIITEVHACKSKSINASGGTVVKTIGNIIYCGMLICPKSAVNCKVISKNDPQNPKVIVRNETCSDLFGNTLDQNIYRFDNPSGNTVDTETGIGPQYHALARKKATSIRENIKRNIQDINYSIQNLPFLIRNIPTVPSI